MAVHQNTRREFIKAAGISTAAALWTLKDPALLDAVTGKPRKRPNLLYVFADQLRYQSVGFAGDQKAQTPNMDRLASEGVSFTNAVSSTPVCAAYRGSLFAGKYASTTGIVINELRMNPNHECFGHVLTRHGYDTGYIGKWHLWANEAGNHDRPRNHFVPPGPYRLGFDGEWSAYNFHHVYYGAHYHKDTPEKIPYGDGVYEPDAQTDMAIDYVRRRADGERPFALFVSWGPPHDPWGRNNAPADWTARFKDVEFDLPANWSDTPDPYMDRHKDLQRWLKFWKPNLPDFHRVYYAMTANLDWNLGRLLMALEQAGIAGETVVVFTSDHGEMFGSHGRIQKAIFYEEAARVPFAIRYPGCIPGGNVCDACLATPDILPTVLGLMRLPIPHGVEGMDLSHLACGQAGPEPDFAFLQGMGHTYLWKDGFEWRALRDKRHTYATYRVDGSELLFDNVNDPLQMHNLAGDPAQREALEHCRVRMRQKADELHDSFQPCSWYRDHWTKDRNIMRGAKGGTHDLSKLARIIGTYFPDAGAP